MPMPLGRRLPTGRPSREACRTTSWLDSTQVVGAPTESVASSERVITAYWAGAVHAAQQVLEVERLVHLVRADVAGQPLGRLHPRLGDQHPLAGVAVQDLPPLPVDLVHAVLVPHRRARLVDLVAGEDLLRLLPVGQVGLLDQAVRHVDPEAVHAAVQPEPQDVQELRVHLRVVPVEVGLAGVEQVQVPLAGLPSGSTVRVQAGPPKTLCQSFGGWSPVGPRPSRKMYRARSGLPGAAASAAWNQRCADEVWFGTRSTITRRLRDRASAISLSASARVPNSGSTSR